MAGGWNGDVDQERGDTSMRSDFGKLHTRSDKLRWASEYHHSEVRLNHNRRDIYRACLMEVTCGSYEDLEGSSESCERHRLGMMVGLAGIYRSAHNNRSFVVVGELALKGATDRKMRGHDQIYLGMDVAAENMKDSWVRKLKRVRLETLKKEEGAQFAHPVRSEKKHYFENPLQEGFCGALKDLRTNDLPSDSS